MTESNRLSGLERMSNLQDFVDLDAVTQDPELNKAIELALKCIAKPEIPYAEVRKAMVLFQGYAFKFKLQALVYMQIHVNKTGTPENIKKNAYMYASEQCHEFAQTLKYLMREQF